MLTYCPYILAQVMESRADTNLLPLLASKCHGEECLADAHLLPLLTSKSHGEEGGTGAAEDGSAETAVVAAARDGAEGATAVGAQRHCLVLYPRHQVALVGWGISRGKSGGEEVK